MSRTLSAVSLAVAIAVATAVAWGGRFDQFTQKFQATPDQAKVVSATYLGGEGTEWLVAGGFQPDGTVVVIGVSLGPKLGLGAAETVLGKDQPAPPAPQRIPLKNKDGTQATDKDGTPRWEPFSWRHENATAFVVRLSSDLRQVKSVSRFPWKAGGVTGGTVDAEGNIYIAGPCGDAIELVGGDFKELQAGQTGNTNPACNHVYLAKLPPDASKVLWLRHLKGPSAAPDVQIDRQGRLRFQGPDLRTFDAAGKQESQVVIPGGITGKTAVNPIDGTYARGGEHHWPTGREPYRDPILNIYRPDGTWLYELYNWDGPYVGLDNLRLVSDSAVRGARYDAEGNLIVHAWSDGGNSVMYREPMDVHTASGKMGGLGFSAWGAGVLSCAYVIKIDTKSYRVIGGTLWLAFLKDKDKPNSITIDTLGFAGDGSVCIAGGSAWGLIQTGNAVGGGEPAGHYVAVLSGDMSSLRFCSAMPACGKADVSDGASQGVAYGKIGGRPMVMFLGGAIEKEDVYGQTRPAPTVKPLQGKFGGGLLDGHILLLDLSGGSN